MRAARARDPVPPLKDGLRELRFHRGLTEDEIRAFHSVLELDSRELAELDVDLVSLLWSKDFQAIDYVAVDELDMAEGQAGLGGDSALARAAQQIVADLAQILGVMSSSGPEAGGSAAHAGAGGAAARRREPALQERPSAPLREAPSLPSR